MRAMAFTSDSISVVAVSILAPEIKKNTLNVLTEALWIPSSVMIKGPV
jgi:hypothetical protein